jgi:hypothetical protein
MKLAFVEIFILDLSARSSTNSLTLVRPYHWRDNIIVGANRIRPLLITFAAHHQ